MAYALGERTRPKIRRPDPASMSRYPFGELASPKCKPSYMKRSRTACRVPARTWCTTGALWASWARFTWSYAASDARTRFSQKSKCGDGTFGLRFSRAQKCDFGFLVDPCTTRPPPRRKIDRRSPCNASDEATRPQTIPTRRRAEGMFIHTRRGAVDRPVAVTWYATGVCYGLQIAGPSRWSGSERASRVKNLTPEKKPPLINPLS